MKNSLKILVFIFSLNLSSCIVPEMVYPQTVSVSFQVFYDELSPYGRWVDYPSYGYVWIPVGYPDFYPYATGGYWAFTDFGCTWVSHYSWGWAPFHYGRWFFDSVYGWMWIPGTDWGPAWVVWINSPGYYGWVPMFPGYGYHIHSYPVNYWTFVPVNDFGKKDIYYGPRSSNAAIVKNSTVIENQMVDKSRGANYYTGPRKEDVQLVTGREIKPVTIQESPKPTQSLRGNQLKIYRPEVKKSGEAENKPAPSRVTKIHELKPMEKKIPSPREEREIQTTPRDKTDVQKEIPGIKKEGERLPVTVPEKKEKEIQSPQRKEKPGIEKGAEQQPKQVVPEEKKKSIQPVPQQKQIERQPRVIPEERKKNIQPIPQQKIEKKQIERQPQQQQPQPRKQKPVEQRKPAPGQIDKRKPR